MSKLQSYRAIFAIAFSALLLSGCGAYSSNSSHPPPAPGGVAHDEPRDDLAKEEPLGWSEHQVLDDHSVRVLFWTGTQECDGHRIEVAETGDTVRISIIRGTIPENPGICDLVARQTSMIATTKAPIGGREIIDGFDS
jgi:hypothetical protein